MAQQIAKGTSRFNSGRGPFGFGMGGSSGGFRYYEYGSQQASRPPQEREVYEANVLDVTPLKVTHEEKKPPGEDSDPMT